MRRSFPQIIDARKLEGPVNCFTHLFSWNPQVFKSKCHVLFHRQGEKLILWVLKDQAHMLRQLVCWVLTDVQPRDGYFTLHFALVKMGNQPVEASTESCFSASARARD